MGLKLKKIKDNPNVVINQLKVGQLNRQTLDIGKLRTALASAENVVSPRRKALYDIYNNILLDGQLGSVIDKRIRAVKTAPIYLEGSDDPEFVKQFETPWFFKTLEMIMETRFWGHTVIEFIPEGGEIAKAKLVPRQNVVPHKGIVTLEMYNEHGAVEYKQEPYCYYMLEIGEPEDLGLLAKLAPYVIYKRNNMGDWAQFNELYGMPIKQYFYDPHNPGSREEVIRQAETMGSAAYIVMPKGTDILLHEAKTTGAGNFKEFHTVMNEEIAITVLGQSLTTSTNGKGSYALGNVHAAVEEGVNLEDKLWVEYVLNWDFKWMLQKHGFNLDGLYFRFDNTQRLSVKEKYEMYQALSQFLPIDPQFIYQELNIPEPDESIVKEWKNRQIIRNPLEFTAGKKIKLHEVVRGLYAGVNTPLTNVQLSDNNQLDKIIEEIIRKIHAGEMAPGDIDKALLDFTSDQLLKAVTQGFGASLDSLKPGSVDYEMLKALETNVYVFSGAKTYAQLKDFTGRLLNEDGTIKPFNDFRDEILSLHKDYNVNWLQTEYNMAVGNSRMASAWMDIERQKQTLPYLQFVAVTDDRSRHKQYHNITLPVDHSAWGWLTPLLDYGCRCRLKQLAEAEVTTDDKVPGKGLIKEEFQFNPGKDKVVFSRNHPYFKNA
jgi:hypothetical protein